MSVDTTSSPPPRGRRIWATMNSEALDVTGSASLLANLALTISL
jgi:hypothetical protein